METAARIAEDVGGRPSRHVERALADVARTLARNERLPWRIRWRLGDLAYRDPGAIRVFEGRQPGGRHALIVTGDLSRSGAPKLLHEMTLSLRADGWGVTMLSPRDGYFRAPLVDAGVTVIVAPELERPDTLLLRELGRRFSADVMICNTINTAPAVAALSRRIPTLWYIHEVSLLRQRLDEEPWVAPILRLPRLLWAGSELPAAILREVRDDVAVVPYGLDPLGDAPPPGADAARPLTIGLFGSYELRKGQDLAVAAMALLPAGVRGQLRLVMHGRELEPDVAAGVRETAATIPEIVVGQELGPDDYRRAVLACDAVLIASRDDTLPLVSLDALGAGRVLMCTPTTGTSAALAPGRSGFVASAPTAEGIAAMLADAVARRRDWPAIGAAGRAVFAVDFSKTAFERRLADALVTLTDARAA